MSMKGSVRVLCGAVEEIRAGDLNTAAGRSDIAGRHVGRTLRLLVLTRLWDDVRYPVAGLE